MRRVVPVLMKISRRTSPYQAAAWAYREAIQHVEAWLGSLETLPGYLGVWFVCFILGGIGFLFDVCECACVCVCVVCARVCVVW